MPTEVSERDRSNLEICKASFTHARLSGEITKRVAAMKSSNPSLRRISDTIQDLSSKLQTWWNSLPAFVSNCKYNLPSSESQLPEHVQLQHVIWLHYSYYGSLLAINSILTQPWTVTFTTTDPSEKAEFIRLVAASKATRIQATRHFVQMIPQTEITMASPKWQVLYPQACLFDWLHADGDCDPGWYSCIL